MSPSLPIPIKNKYKTPLTLGNDRLAGAVGAFKLFPKKNSLIVDMGTCIKYDFINNKGEYLGGSITPGLAMRLRALYVFTNKLPLIKLDKNQEKEIVLGIVKPDKKSKKFIGNSTQESIQTGVIQGIINEINGFAKLYSGRYRGLKIILTGGDSNRFVRALNFPIFASPNLTGIGLNEILTYNLKQEKRKI